jgi:hypothetical protein
MPPFNTKEVACYLLWIAIGVGVVGIVILLTFHAQSREPLHSDKPGATVQLHWPAAAPLHRG